MLIGTHSRIIEGDLMRILLDGGCTFEMAVPASLGLLTARRKSRSMATSWVNPKLEGVNWDNGWFKRSCFLIKSVTLPHHIVRHEAEAK
jgi:hypothetical protein